MRIDIATLFVEMCERVLEESIIGRARRAGKLEVHCHNIRDYTQDKHKRVDDTPYGGGKGMLMQVEPIYQCYLAVCKEITAAKRESSPSVPECGPDTVCEFCQGPPLGQDWGTGEGTETVGLAENAPQMAEPRRELGKELTLEVFSEQSDQRHSDNLGDLEGDQDGQRSVQNPAPNQDGQTVSQDSELKQEGDLCGTADISLDTEQELIRPHVIYLSPKGAPFTQKRACELKELDHIFLLCGHYEGVDQRVLDEIVDEEISIGDYVLTGGELGALVIVDAVGRLCDGVLSEEVCFIEESHYNGLLEYPQYTRPPVWHGREVPPVLLSGHHANIEKWRREQSLLVTRERRPDLLEQAELTKKEKDFLQNQMPDKRPESEE